MVVALGAVLADVFGVDCQFDLVCVFVVLVVLHVLLLYEVGVLQDPGC